uniref:Nuclear transcription factor Y subunit n=1 Tax=Kalanchoe fedtschenkoi TaxID=63787 RepID=A0A7N0V5F1_KALFE
MQTVYLKEYEGMSENTIGHLTSGQRMPWWAADSHSDPTDAFRHLKALPAEHAAAGSQFTLTKSDPSEVVKGAGKGGSTQFTISTGGERNQHVRASVTVQPTLPDYQSHLESGFGQAMVYSKYPYGDQSYSVMSTYGPQVAVQGRVMLPLDMTSDDGPIYVNAKQYHGIIRRRLYRAKAELVKKSIRARKPYMHESRHLHAMRRPRGCGGRFLNTKISDAGMGGNSMKSTSNGLLTQPTGSPSSGIFQSDSGTLNSPKQSNSDMSHISGSEATSMYTRGDLRRFTTNFLSHSLPAVMDTGHGIGAPSHWVAAAQNCCNLNA